MISFKYVNRCINNADPTIAMSNHKQPILEYILFSLDTPFIAAKHEQQSKMAGIYPHAINRSNSVVVGCDVFIFKFTIQSLKDCWLNKFFVP